VDFMFVLIGLFSLGVTAEGLRANIDLKIGATEGGGSAPAKCLRSRGRLPRTIFGDR